MNNGQKQIGLASHFEWVFWHPIRFGTPKTVTYECDFQIIRIPSNFQRRENFRCQLFCGHGSLIHRNISRQIDDIASLSIKFNGLNH